METINKRIDIIFKDSGLKKIDFAKSLGINTRSLYDYSQANTKPSFDVMCKLVENFNVDANWLILGEGPHYRKAPDEPIPVQQVNDTNVNIFGRQTNNVTSTTTTTTTKELKAYEVQSLMAQISQLQDTIAKLTDTNQQLVAKILSL